MSSRLLVLIRKRHDQAYPVTATFTDRDRAYEAVDELLANRHGLAWLRLVENADGSQRELLVWPP